MKLEVSIDDTIEDVKMKISKETGISTEDQKLFWGGHELKDFRTVAVCLIVIGAKFLNGNLRLEVPVEIDR